MENSVGGGHVAFLCDLAKVAGGTEERFLEIKCESWLNPMCRRPPPTYELS